MEAAEFKAYSAVEQTNESTALTDREKHLIGLAVTATRGSSDLAAAVNAGVTLRTAIEGAERNKIDAACTGAECSGGTEA